jgi:hypothetical protein
MTDDQLQSLPRIAGVAGPQKGTYGQISARPGSRADMATEERSVGVMLNTWRSDSD